MMNIIICEGITEVALVYNLNAKINGLLEGSRLENINHNPFEIGENIYLINLKGKDTFKEVIKKLYKQLADKEVNRISFIMDADDNYDAMKDNIKDKIEKIKNKGIECEYSYYILPSNNGELGMAEDLVLKSLYAENLVNLIETDIFSQLKEHSESNIRNDAKTKFMIFGATQIPQTSSPSFMMKRAKELIDFENPCYDELKMFIENAIK